MQRIRPLLLHPCGPRRVSFSYHTDIRDLPFWCPPLAPICAGTDGPDWYDPGDGVWTVGTWTASVTADPTVATAVVPEGTIASYATYQSAVNSVVAASAEAAAANGTISGAERTYGVPFDVRGWTVGMGLVGAVVGAVLA